MPAVAEYRQLPSEQYLNPVPDIKRKVPDLAYEVAKIRFSGDEALYLLPGTGFHVDLQVNLLLSNLSSGVSFEDSMGQIGQDVQGFKVEYLTEQPVFPIVLDKVLHEGRTRLVGKLYGGKPVVESTSADERDGVVRESIQKIEERLLKANPGSLAIMTSPKGWSGYQSREGILEKLNEADVFEGRAKEVRYPDSQTYCFQVQEDGKIRGFTLKTDMDIFQNEKLLNKLGVSSEHFEENLDYRSRIKQAVRNLVFIGPEKNLKIEDIAQKIQQIAGKETAYIDSLDKRRNFSEMMQLLHNPEPLWALDEKTQDLVDQFTQYASYRITYPDERLKRDIEVALGLTVMKLMREVRPPKPRIEMQDRAKNRLNSPMSVALDPRGTLEEMQQLAGCAGGGKDKDTVNSITPRAGELGDKKILCCTCPFCKEKVEAEIKDGTITCPKCAKSAPWKEPKKS